MSLAPGTRLGPYDIVAPIGAGGMGEVYRARDTRLDRIVALKVLPEHLAADAAARERFEREARSVAALNHPRICTLHDVGTHGGLSFLVMEHLEGETLADRLSRSPNGLPVAEAIAIAQEVASALAAAHGGGIVHRDLKPGNVMLTKAGSKLLDFGLAKMRPPVTLAAAASAATAAPLTSPTTIVGTLQYMSPEQLIGGEVDPRSDMFSFGCVLYEMITGRRAFDGATPASVIGAVLERDPRDVADLAPVAPPLLHDLIRACLIKDRERRWHSAADAGRMLAWAASDGVAAARSTPSSWPWPWLAALAAAMLAIGGLAGRWLTPAAAPPLPVVLSVVPPPGTSLHARTNESVEMAVSPDGRHLAFVASESGVRRLFVRALDSADAREVEDSAGADLPFWSPDSANIGFFARGKLMKVSRAGGVPQVLTEAGATPGGATWNRDGVIVFSPFFEGALYRVSAAGGAASPLTTLGAANGETHHHRPRFLPDGRHYLYSVYAREGSGEYVGRLDSVDRTLLMPAPKAPAGFGGESVDYAPGHLAFVRDTTLLVQPFDPDRRLLTGEPVRIAEGIARAPGGFTAFSAASGAATLAYRTADPQPIARLTWFDRAGRAVGWVGPPGAYEDPSLSPDGSRVAVQRWDTPERRSIWIIDTARGIESRLTTNPDDLAPLWSPDGSRVVFSSARDTPPNLFARPLPGAAVSEERLFTSRFLHVATGWSSDGRTLLHDTFEARTGGDIMAFDLQSRTNTAVLQTAAEEGGATLSPDGRWVLYSSNETGRIEVYVRPFRGAGPSPRLSTNGGRHPLWRRDGREVFYIEGGRKLMSVPISGEAVAGQPVLLFEAAFAPANRRPYDVSADGQRVLVDLIVNEAPASPITVVLNWSIR